MLWREAGDDVWVKIPLLKGEGDAKRRVRGEEKHLFFLHV
jgi:hypothetical protein